MQVLFVMTFGLGLGPVTWLLPAELFPMRKRAPPDRTLARTLGRTLALPLS